MLYECLTSQRPFVGDTVAELLARIQAEEPSLHTRTAGVPRDLATVVAKCLAKESEGRYPTAKELADDLGRFVRGEPIAAGPVERAAR
jgi:serine/threonine-protein kinase